jgi:hypothetical protein
MIRILRLLSTALASLGLLTACAGQSATTGNANFVPSRNDATNRQTFHFTGIAQTFQVPSGVDKVTIMAEGAGTPSARGGLVRATIAVTPGDALTITVGGAPIGRQGGYNGGADGGFCAVSGGCLLRGDGGAGASDVRRGGSALANRILVAGGAGGQGGRGRYHGGDGGEGGGVSGGRGDDGVTVGSRHSYGRIGGGGGAGGGTQRRGGTRGAAGKVSNQFIVPGNFGSPGTLAIGGSGADNSCSICSITYAYGLAGGAGGGGGGGYYGGGGGGSGGNANSGQGRKALGSGGGGGGGSSFVEPGAQNVSIETGRGSDGDGLIVISW